MAYYKGKFFYTNDLKYEKFNKCIAKTGYRYLIKKDGIELYDSGFLIDYSLRDLLIKTVYEASMIKDYKINEKLVNCFNKVFSSDITNSYSDIISSNKYDIIYEIVKDSNGDLYAKELYTGLLFPILSRNNYAIDY